MIDIQNYIYASNLYVRETEEDYVLYCPHCERLYGSKDESGHLNVSKHKRVVHCYRCDYAASWIGFIMQTEHVSYYEALGVLYAPPNLANFANRIKFDKKVEPKPVISYTNQVTLPESFTPLTVGSGRYVDGLRRYALRRGFTSTKCRKYNIGYMPEHLFRIVIPIEGTFYQARAITDELKPKYFNPPHIDAETVIFNSAALKTFDSVVICEGFFSAVACGDVGIALVGKNPTKSKIKRLTSSPVKRFIITVEHNANNTMYKLADVLVAYGKNVDLWYYEEGQDPASVKRPYKISTYNMKHKVGYLLYGH